MTHRSLLIVVSVVAFCFVQLAGQTGPDEKSEVVAAKAVAVAPTETAPKFTSRSMLVLVPVVVSRKNGTHIEGLGRAGQIENRLVAQLKPEILVRVRNSGLGMRQSLELAPGKYKLHFAVRDNLSGEIGSVEYPFEVK
jgi:hypothetical protein